MKQDAAPGAHERATPTHPVARHRRLRSRHAVRRLFAETDIEPRRLVQPYFVVPGAGIVRETRPGSALWQVSADAIVAEVRPLADAGVGGVMLFGVPERKSDDLAECESQMSWLRKAIEELRARCDGVVVLADVCLCSYSTHGHCGVVRNGRIVNDETLPALAHVACLLASAGADFVVPSDMMDGRVAAIRAELDARGHGEAGIVVHAVKIASALYGPFRDAAHGTPTFGDRQSYQLPAGNAREARREWQADVAEGADALLVKPALTNLDIIRDMRASCALPIMAYQVSGEFAMMAAASAAGVLDFDRAMDECLLSIRRSGADMIVTYDARRRLLRGG